MTETTTRASEGRDALPVLDYGRQSTVHRRVRRGIALLLIIASLAGGLWYAIPNLIHSMKLKSAVAECNAWAENARTSVLPEQTLLYSEVASDQSSQTGRTGTISITIYGNSPGQNRSTTMGQSFAAKYQAMRELAYLAGGIPIFSDFRNIVYVHEHPLWLASPGSPPPLFSVYYIGPSSSGNPQFGVTSRMFPLDAKGQSNMVGGIATAPLPGRPLANLRIYAGQPHPTDPTRFSIPFSCDAGTGRFEFQTDTDASDEGDVVPKVTITWDPTPSTQPN